MKGSLLLLILTQQAVWLCVAAPAHVASVSRQRACVAQVHGVRARVHGRAPEGLRRDAGAPHPDARTRHQLLLGQPTAEWHAGARRRASSSLLRLTCVTSIFCICICIRRCAGALLLLLPHTMIVSVDSVHSRRV